MGRGPNAGRCPGLLRRARTRDRPGQSCRLQRDAVSICWATVAASTTRDALIETAGNGTLALSGESPGQQLTGSSGRDFEILSESDTTVSPGESITLCRTLLPVRRRHAKGLTVAINNSGADEVSPQFSLSIAGAGVTPEGH